ncbi:MAG: DMT family transporter, partial [Anaerolineae bacterium]
MNRPFLVWLLLSTVWGSTWLFIKVGLAYLPPFTFAGVRFVVALIPLVILLLIRRPLIPKKLGDWALIFITGFITFSVNYGLVFWGENHISSGLTAILYTTMPLFGLVMAHFVIPSEPMNVFKVAGVLLGIFGVSVIFSNQLQLENTAALWGVTAIVVAAITTAYADILIKVRGKHLDPLVLTVGQMLVGFGPLLLVGW